MNILRSLAVMWSVIFVIYGVLSLLPGKLVIQDRQTVATLVIIGMVMTAACIFILLVTGGQQTIQDL